MTQGQVIKSPSQQDVLGVTLIHIVIALSIKSETEARLLEIIEGPMILAVQRACVQGPIFHSGTVMKV